VRWSRRWIRRDPADLPDTGGREPQRAVRPRRDSFRGAVQGNGVFGDVPRGGDATDLTVARLREPQGPVGADDDLVERALGRIRPGDWDGEAVRRLEHSGRGDPVDPAGPLCHEPDCAVRPRRDPAGGGARGQWELVYRPRD
jgi:hypothetical protein